MDDPAQTHPVHATLQQLEALKDSSQLTDLNEELDDLRQHSLDRIFYLTSETRKRLLKIKGVRANLSVFTNIQNSAQSIRQELENYISNKNLGHVDNALNQADQALAIYLSQLPAGSVAAEAETALESFRKSSRSAVGELKANGRCFARALHGAGICSASHKCRSSEATRTRTYNAGPIHRTFAERQESRDS